MQLSLQDSRRELLAISERDLDLQRTLGSPEQKIKDLEGQLEREKMMKMTVNISELRSPEFLLPAFNF